jgi:hypothetical protein
MVNYRGVCSYPHGGYITVGLLFASAAAMAATTYACASCRMFVMTYTTRQGCFTEAFSWYGTGGIEQQDAIVCKEGIGLYQWLHPTLEGEVYPHGYCVGYQKSMRQLLSDGMFDKSRGAGVFAVLLSLVVHLWSFSLSCLENNWVQIMLYRTLCFTGMILTGCTFAFSRSKLCTDMFEERECSVDEGGLVMITGVILWCVCFLVSFMFLTPNDEDDDDDDDDDDVIEENKHIPGFPREQPAAVHPAPNSFAAFFSSKKPKQTKTEQVVTVDDITTQGEMEVYLNKDRDLVVENA